MPGTRPEPPEVSSSPPRPRSARLRLKTSVGCVARSAPRSDVAQGPRLRSSRDRDALPTDVFKRSLGWTRGRENHSAARWSAGPRDEPATARFEEERMPAMDATRNGNRAARATGRREFDDEGAGPRKVDATADIDGRRRVLRSAHRNRARLWRGSPPVRRVRVRLSGPRTTEPRTGEVATQPRSPAGDSRRHLQSRPDPLGRQGPNGRAGAILHRLDVERAHPSRSTASAKRPAARSVVTRF